MTSAENITNFQLRIPENWPKDEYDDTVLFIGFREKLAPNPLNDNSTILREKLAFLLHSKYGEIEQLITETNYMVVCFNSNVNSNAAYRELKQKQINGVQLIAGRTWNHLGKGRLELIKELNLLSIVVKSRSILQGQGSYLKTIFSRHGSIYEINTMVGKAIITFKETYSVISAIAAENNLPLNGKEKTVELYTDSLNGNMVKISTLALIHNIRDVCLQSRGQMEEERIRLVFSEYGDIAEIDTLSENIRVKFHTASAVCKALEDDRLHNTPFEPIILRDRLEQTLSLIQPEIDMPADHRINPPNVQSQYLTNAAPIGLGLNEPAPAYTVPVMPTVPIPSLLPTPTIVPNLMPAITIPPHVANNPIPSITVPPLLAANNPIPSLTVPPHSANNPIPSFTVPSHAANNPIPSLTVPPNAANNLMPTITVPPPQTAKPPVNHIEVICTMPECMDYSKQVCTTLRTLDLRVGVLCPPNGGKIDQIVESIKASGVAAGVFIDECNQKETTISVKFFDHRKIKLQDIPLHMALGELNKAFHGTEDITSQPPPVVTPLNRPPPLLQSQPPSFPIQPPVITNMQPSPTRKDSQKRAMKKLIERLIDDKSIFMKDINDLMKYFLDKRERQLAVEYDDYIPQRVKQPPIGPFADMEKKIVRENIEDMIDEVMKRNLAEDLEHLEAIHAETVEKEKLTSALTSLLSLRGDMLKNVIDDDSLQSLRRKSSTEKMDTNNGGYFWN